MQSRTLREKERIVLNSIVESYLRVGRPVSSGSLVQKKTLPVSPATIRNIMVKLEEMGYLHQPHTSAGRIPSDKALRFYVSSLSGRFRLPQAPYSVNLGEFSVSKGDLTSLLDEVSRVLAERSDNLGFVLSPCVSKLGFTNLRFFQVAETKVMTILTTPSNLVLTEIVRTSCAFTQNELDQAAQYINLNFRGRNLVYIRDYLLRELPRYRAGYENAVNKLISLLKACITQEEAESQIHLQGASRLLGKPDLADMESLKRLFQKFEERAKLAKLLSDFISLDRVKVLIGSEVNIPDIADCSLVLSHYGSDHQVLGTLGIIGPKRIPYLKIISLVDSMAKRLSETISQEH